MADLRLRFSGLIDSRADLAVIRVTVEVLESLPVR